MAKSFGPIEIECDAPPYYIVQATRQIGLVCPEDVRWARLNHHSLEQRARASKLAAFRAYNALPTRPPPGPICVCGQHLPKLRRVSFCFDTGSSVSYFLTQCERCRAVFWEPA